VYVLIAFGRVMHCRFGTHAHHSATPTVQIHQLQPSRASCYDPPMYSSRGSHRLCLPSSMGIMIKSTRHARQKEPAHQLHLPSSIGSTLRTVLIKPLEMHGRSTHPHFPPSSMGITIRTLLGTAAGAPPMPPPPSFCPGLRTFFCPEEAPSL